MRLTIQSRLLLVLNLLIVSITILASVAIVLLVFWFEHTLFYKHLDSDLQDHIRSYHSVAGPLVRPMSDTTYYKLPQQDLSLLPKAFRGYPQGKHEVLLGDRAYNLLVLADDGWLHLLVQDQSEFERYEQLVVVCMTAGILLVWGGGICSLADWHSASCNPSPTWSAMFRCCSKNQMPALLMAIRMMRLVSWRVHLSGMRCGSMNCCCVNNSFRPMQAMSCEHL